MKSVQANLGSSPKGSGRNLSHAGETPRVLRSPVREGSDRRPEHRETEQRSEPTDGASFRPVASTLPTIVHSGW